MGLSRSDPDLQAGLLQLQGYMRRYLSETHDPEQILAEFWTIPDDELFGEVLTFLPLFLPRELCMSPGVPVGFRLAYPLYALEDDYNFNGYTAFRNNRDILPQAIEAYGVVGMPEEAEAVRVAMLGVDSSYDDETIGAAYRSVGSPYEDDDVRWKALWEFFRRNRGLFESSR